MTPIFHTYRKYTLSPKCVKVHQITETTVSFNNIFVEGITKDTPEHNQESL